MMYGSIPDVELRRFYSLWRDMALVYDEWSKARGISDSAVLVLHSLYYERGGCTQKMICDKWLFPKHKHRFKRISPKGDISIFKHQLVSVLNFGGRDLVAR